MQIILKYLKKILFKLHRLTIKFINSYSKILRHPVLLFIRTLIRVAVVVFLVLSYFLLYFYNINLDAYLSVITERIVAIAAAFSLLTSTFANEIGDFVKGLFGDFGDAGDNDKKDSGSIEVKPSPSKPVNRGTDKSPKVEEPDNSLLSSVNRRWRVMMDALDKSASENLNRPLETNSEAVQKGSWVEFSQNHPIMILTCAAVVIGGVYFLSVSEPETIKGVFTTLTAGITTIFSRNAGDVTGTGAGTGTASVNADGQVELTQSSGYSLSSFFKRLFNPFRSQGVRSAPTIGDGDVPSGSVVPYEQPTDPAPSRGESVATVRELVDKPLTTNLTPKELSDKHTATLAELMELKAKLEKAESERENVDCAKLATA
jgi:hypothetical protein